MNVIKNKTNKVMDIKNWTQIKISDIFEIVQETRDNQAPKLNEGNIPLVSACKINNGVVKRIDKALDGSTLFKKYTITVNMFGRAFLQLEDFYAVSHGRITMLIPKYKEMHNKWVGLFLATLLTNTFEPVSSYESMCGKNDVEGETIKIPYTSDGQPDWEFMRNCMQKIEKISNKHVIEITREQVKNTISDVVDTSSWKPFPLCGKTGLFNIVSGKSGTKKEQNKGNIPFVSSSGVNNGVTLLCDDDGLIYEGNAITINKNGSVGYSFWQKDKFKASSDVACCTPNTDYFKNFVLDRRIAHFITTLIMVKGKNTYSWNDKWGMDDMKKDTISLPVDANGQPDWDFMRDYMQNIENKCDEYMNKCKNQINNLFQSE